MTRTRVVLGNMAPILREILKDLISKQSDLEVVGEAASVGALPAAIEAHRAEAVVVTLSAADAPETICALQALYPRLTVLSFAHDRHEPVVWPCEGAPHPVGPDAASVVDALRRQPSNARPA